MPNDKKKKKGKNSNYKYNPHLEVIVGEIPFIKDGVSTRFNLDRKEFKEWMCEYLKFVRELGAISLSSEAYQAGAKQRGQDGLSILLALQNTDRMMGMLPSTYNTGSDPDNDNPEFRTSRFIKSLIQEFYDLDNPVKDENGRYVFQVKEEVEQFMQEKGI